MSDGDRDVATVLVFAAIAYLGPVAALVFAWRLIRSARARAAV